MVEKPLEPFGLLREYPPGTRFEDLDTSELKALVTEHRVLVLRGLVPIEDKTDFVDDARRLGYLQPWAFGAVHDLKVDPDAENYLYTTHEVPLHWDGAFAREAPHLLLFYCVESGGTCDGGTVFVDTTRALAAASDAQRKRWNRRLRLRTERKAYYGGTVRRPMMQAHPLTGEPILRYAEPVRDLNPVDVQPELPDLAAHLTRDEFRLVHHWKAGDVVLADNDALLHGREAFAPHAARRLWRANVLHDRRPWWQPLADSWRIRRPEFIRAEIPIVLIPAVLAAPKLESLWSWAFLEVVLLFWLLFQVGDVVNCWADRHADRVFKTRLSESVRRLGKRNIQIQLVVMAVLALALGAHLRLVLQRPYWLFAGILIGGVMAALYSIGPKPMKRSGVFQIGWYVVILFVGPMGFISGAFLDWPSFSLLAVAASFGLMQAGVLLINNAEDLREDREVHARTASVALGPRRVITVALVATSIGALGVVTLLFERHVATLAFVATVLVVLGWLVTLNRRARDTDFDQAMKKAGRWVPHVLTANAWAVLWLAMI